MHNTTLEILEAKRRALNYGNKVVATQTGGECILGVYNKCFSMDIHIGLLNNSVKANTQA